MGLWSREIVAGARPGQFVMIKAGLSADPLLRRPFSICAIQGNDVFCILYRVVGRGTKILSRVTEGNRLSVLGPLGRGFDFPKADQKPFIVAGGIGIAPLIFLAQAINSDNLTFMAGYRHKDEIVAMEKFSLSGMEINIATDDGTAGHHGPVTELLEARLDGPDEDRRVVFACGPLPMLERVADLTNDSCIPCQVSLETTMACGLGACLGCAVKAASKETDVYYHVCKDGPVFDVKTLYWGAR